MYAEYAYTLKVDKKADIYSFGVIILELVTGKHPTDHEQFGDHISMVEWLQAKIKTSNVVLEEIVDGRLKPCPRSTAMQIESVMRIGLACTSTPPVHRPSMQRVVNMLLDIRSQNHPLISKLDLTSPLHFTHSFNQPEA
ncbi:hypothetical protein O6H91_21G049300 [Diphasiastrum complanatum]|uniref:Uncharacterized protein n=1 Tax=Diphasiastrum complanatum TaxID=34168 RepID=A0ACC2AK95_DIPCM|nr:hypothetical protein O6H91_21G049300 [Diphasiastrum complanatum]